MKILFCSDGSAQAESALRFGAPVAAACQAETTILGISETGGEEEPLLKALRRGQEILKEHHLNAELVSKTGHPVHEIARRTAETAYDLVVIGAVRAGGHGPRLMSARAYSIIEGVAPPVLVVIGQRPALRRILLCTRGGRGAARSIPFTGEIARQLSASVDLFHVMPEPPAMYADLLRKEEEDATRLLQSGSSLGRHLRHQKEALGKLGVPGEVRLRHGMVIPELLRQLQAEDYDLVVAASERSPGTLRRYVMGDITREIVNHADRPVLVLRAEGKGLLERMAGWFGRRDRPPNGPAIP